MTEHEEDEILDSARSLISVVNDSVAGYARHTASLASRVTDPNDAIDPMRELGLCWNRTLHDSARLFRATWTLLEGMAWRQSKGPGTPPAPDSPPPSNLCQKTIGPVASTGQINPQGLRRRGETQVSIPSTKVKAVRSPTDPTQVDLEIEAGGASRGLYEGTLTIGSQASATRTSYNIYVDW